MLRKMACNCCTTRNFRTKSCTDSNAFHDRPLIWDDNLILHKTPVNWKLMRLHLILHQTSNCRLIPRFLDVLECSRCSGVLYPSQWLDPLRYALSTSLYYAVCCLPRCEVILCPHDFLIWRCEWEDVHYRYKMRYVSRVQFILMRKSNEIFSMYPSSAAFKFIASGGGHIVCIRILNLKR